MPKKQATKAPLTPKDEFLKRTVKKNKETCSSRHCKGERAKRSDGLIRAYCWKCEKRWWRNNNLRKDRWGNLRHNAIRRGIKFDLSFGDFCKICDATGYTSDGHVQFGDRMSLDRIEREKGYVLTNLRVISVRENSKRYTNPKICVNGVWLDHTCVSFEEDPLNEIRMQAVQEKIAGRTTAVEERPEAEDEDGLPDWLRETPKSSSRVLAHALGGDPF